MVLLKHLNDNYSAAAIHYQSFQISALSGRYLRARGFAGGELELGAVSYGAKVFFSVASSRFFCMPSQADPSQALDGEAWPALVTWGTAPGGRRAVSLRETGRDPQLLHTPLSSPREREDPDRCGMLE